MPDLTRCRSPYRYTVCWNSVAYSGRSGRGPTMLISPLSTLRSCGSSSSDVLRNSAPTGVRRSSAPSTPPGPSTSAETTRSLAGCASLGRIERNLSISKVRPSRPMRLWRKRIGRPSETSTARDRERMTGDRRRRATAATIRSIAYLTLNSHARGSALRGETSAIPPTWSIEYRSGMRS